MSRRGAPARTDVQSDRLSSRGNGLSSLRSADRSKPLCRADGCCALQSGCNSSRTLRLKRSGSTSTQNIPTTVEVRSRASRACLACTVQFRSCPPLAARVHSTTAIGSELATSFSIKIRLSLQGAQHQSSGRDAIYRSPCNVGSKQFPPIQLIDPGCERSRVHLNSAAASLLPC